VNCSVTPKLIGFAPAPSSSWSRSWSGSLTTSSRKWFCQPQIAHAIANAMIERMSRDRSSAR
jgi:hypothetical protein